MPAKKHESEQGAGRTGGEGGVSGGGKGIRTPDLLAASQTLSQLSYTPTEGVPADAGGSESIATAPCGGNAPRRAARLDGREYTRRCATCRSGHNDVMDDAPAATGAPRCGRARCSPRWRARGSSSRRAAVLLAAGHATASRTGSVDFTLRPAWPGGRLVLPLGPAGVARAAHPPRAVDVDGRLPPVRRRHLARRGRAARRRTCRPLQASARPRSPASSGAGCRAAAAARRRRRRADRRRRAAPLAARSPWGAALGVAGAAALAGGCRRRA